MSCSLLLSQFALLFKLAGMKRRVRVPNHGNKRGLYIFDNCCLIAKQCNKSLHDNTKKIFVDFSSAYQCKNNLKKNER